VKTVGNGFFENVVVRPSLAAWGGTVGTDNDLPARGARDIQGFRDTDTRTLNGNGGNERTNDDCNARNNNVRRVLLPMRRTYFPRPERHRTACATRDRFGRDAEQEEHGCSSKSVVISENRARRRRRRRVISEPSSYDGVVYVWRTCGR